MKTEYTYSPSDFSMTQNLLLMEELLYKLNYGFVDFHSEFGRNHSDWSIKQKSQFIESIVIGMNSPSFCFEEVNQRHWNIIDGFNRCVAIYDFCVKKSFSLEGMEFIEKFNGKKYDDFDFQTKREFVMSRIVCNVLSPGAPFQIKQSIFNRLHR